MSRHGERGIGWDMLTIVLPLLVAVIGVLVYALVAAPKLSEIGRLVFFAGLFWTVYVLAQKTISLG